MADEEKFTVNDAIDAVADFAESIGQSISAWLRAVGDIDLLAAWRFLLVAAIVAGFVTMFVGVGVMFFTDVRAMVRRLRRRP